MDIFAELKRNVAMSMTLPAGRFFTPKPAFWRMLKTFKDVRWIDAGCGAGDTTVEARGQGVNMVGVDLCMRQGQHEEVMQLDAIRMPYGPTVWPAILRPNHDGWAQDCVEAALKRGAKALYVSKPSNFEVDIDGDHFTIEKIWKNVGRDGETAWLLVP